MTMSAQALEIKGIKKTRKPREIGVVQTTRSIPAARASGTDNEISSRLAAIKAVSEFVRAYLKDHKRKISWLAAQSGVHRMTISRIIHGDTLADPATLRALAQVMDAPQERLLALAGYLDTSPEREDKGITIPALDDPELGFYLCQIGELDAKTRDVIKTILREDYLKRQELHQAGQTTELKRPPFARPGLAG